MKLYKLKTRTIECYCVAESPNDAKDKFEKDLNDRDYGYSKERVVVSIELIADSQIYGYVKPGSISDDGYAYKLLL